MSKLIIFGTGDIAQIANHYFTIDTEYEVVCFTVNKEYINMENFEGKPVIAFEDIEKLYPVNDYEMFIALSYSELNKTRATKYLEAKSKGYKLATYISSKCTFLTKNTCGDNCFIFEDNTIQPFVEIGNNITLWSGNHIGHHSILEDHLFISSHVVISGHCKICSYTFIGVNSTIGHQVTIERENLIGAGSIITKSTEIGDVYVPSKSIKLEKKSNHFKI